ncbi:MAG: hypothetical protein AAFV96_05410, partial [Pseudomonadota bacterium]
SDDVGRIDAVEALLRAGQDWYGENDPRAEEALTLALTLPGDPKYDRLQKMYDPDRDFSDIAARKAEIQARIDAIRAAAAKW